MKIYRSTALSVFGRASLRLVESLKSAWQADPRGAEGAGTDKGGSVGTAAEKRRYTVDRPHIPYFNPYYIKSGFWNQER